MSRVFSHTYIADDRQLDLLEFIETAAPRPFSIWCDDSGKMEVVLDGDCPATLVTGLVRKIQAVGQEQQD